MTRYVNRQPQIGDRVEMPAERGHIVSMSSEAAEVRGDHGGGTKFFRLERLLVIAPDPAVGDVVTADMDLPEGSIIECVSDRYFGVCRLDTGTWWRDSNSAAQPVFGSGSWRIVRIGGAPDA